MAKAAPPDQLVIPKMRMPNPAVVIEETMAPIQALNAAAHKGGIGKQLLDLVHLRASQINSCSVCVHSGTMSARQSGEDEERLSAIAAWRDAPYFTAAERAALALTEHVTRLADRPDPVPDEIWDEAARHFDQKGLAALLISISVTNVFNRLNVSTRQVAGAWGWSTSREGSSQRTEASRGGS
jgi:AhpD family alkylhydroperoxidase